MAFIDTIPDSDINADVRAMYERQQSFWGFVPNYARVFCYRPEIMGLWAQLQAGIKKNMDKRRFELITFAAAHTMRSTLCSLAHGRALTAFFSMEDVQLMARGASPASLTAAEAAMMTFARKVARGAFAIAPGDVTELRSMVSPMPKSSTSRPPWRARVLDRRHRIAGRGGRTAIARAGTRIQTHAGLRPAARVPTRTPMENHHARRKKELGSDTVDSSA